MTTDRGQKIPRGSVSSGATRVFLAVVADEWPTISRIVRQTGLSQGGVHRQLKALREAGLVEWTDGQRGTLHALYRPVRPKS